MRFIRLFLPGLLTGALVAAVMAPAAAQAAVGIEKFVGANCVAAHEGCGEKAVGVDVFAEPLEETVEPGPKESEEEGYRQAGGRVPYGVTDFMVTHIGEYKEAKAIPTGIVTHVRVDVAPGLATSPAAVPQCSQADFGDKEAFEGSKLGFYTESKCATGTGPHGTGPESTVIGEEKATVYVKGLEEKYGLPDVAIKGVLYNLVQPEGRSSEFGAALKLPMALTAGALKEFFAYLETIGKAPSPTEQAAAEAGQYYAHTIVEGGVEWGKEAKGTEAADYHDYFEVKVSPALPLIRSRQLDYGTAGNGAFITNATQCGNPINQVTRLSLEGITPGSTTKETEERLAGPQELAQKEYKTALGLDGCSSLLFEPAFELAPSTTQTDQPDAFTAEASELQEPAKPAQSQVRSALFTLPPGMTLNPSAANNLEACKPYQAHQEGTAFSSKFGMECPTASKLGKVELEVPTLPAITESKPTLEGSVYLAGPENGPITGPPYTIYVDADSARYGVSVRMLGEVVPNETTGQVTTYFNNPPEQPFTNLKIEFERGALAPIANPLLCGAAKTETSFTPFSGTALQSPFSEFNVDSNGSGGACGSPGLALSQSTQVSNSNADAYTSFTLGLSRGDGQQYLSKVSTTLPEGLLGTVPSVTLCGEAEANAGTCGAASKIGTATVKAGAGSEPFQLSGPVYMTGPYAGAPYGLSIVVPATAGPFQLGNVVTRATVSVNPSTTQLTVTANVPTIKGGVPFRIKNLNIAVEREKFLFNPTNCGALSTTSSLNGTPTLPPVSGATQGISTPFQVSNCNSLQFKPSFTAATSAKTSRAKGASLKVNIGYPAGPQANIKAVKVELPKQLPSRLTTLNKACTEAQFNANPANCPAASKVGTATVTTPVLPDKMIGPAILVSHGGAAFPDLEFVLSADNVTVILDGQTQIKKGVTSSTFSSVPDAPISGFELNLPTGTYSLLTVNGNVCAQPLVMPTIIEGQNGAKITQSTKIGVTGCGIVILSHKIKGHKAKITVVTPAAGKVTVSGKYLKTAKRKLRKAGKATLTVSLSKKGLAALRKSKKHKLKVKITARLKPSKGSSSKASTTVTFRR